MLVVMRKHVATFVFGVLLGGIGVGGIALWAGDPYEYMVLRPYICEQYKIDPARYWTVRTVPDQDDPCFVMAARHPWLTP